MTIVETLEDEMPTRIARFVLLLILALGSRSSLATELKVLHSWTDPALANAVQVLEDAFNQTGNRWEGSASASTLGNLTTTRILSGDAMGAVLLTPGGDVDSLVHNGNMLDLTDLATNEGWLRRISPWALAPCTYDGRIFCVPVQLHSDEWLWISLDAYKKAGAVPPTTWSEFLESADKLKSIGIRPLAVSDGWAIKLMMRNVERELVDADTIVRTYQGDSDLAKGAEYGEVWKAFDALRQMVPSEVIQGQWIEAVNSVVAGKAGATIMGDWAGPEFQRHGLTAGVDFDCLPGLGFGDAISTEGEAMYFPKSAGNTEAQEALARVLLSEKVQSAFSKSSGALPAITDLDLSADACLRKTTALEKCPKKKSRILDPDAFDRIGDLELAFFHDRGMSVEQAQAKFADIIASSPPGIDLAEKKECCKTTSNCPENP